MERKNNEPCFDPEKLSEIFDRFMPDYKVSVTTAMPHNLKISEIIGIAHYPDHKKTKCTYRRNGWIYLCVLNTKDFSVHANEITNKIKENPDWHERYEHWELFGDEKPYEKMSRLLKFRIKNEQEKEWWRFFYEK